MGLRGKAFFCSAESVTVGRFRRSASQTVTADGVELELKDVKRVGMGKAVDPVRFTQSVATVLGMKLTEASRSGSLRLSPDNRTQVTIEFVHRVDGSVEPVRIHTVGVLVQPEVSVTSCRHALAMNTGIVTSVPQVEDTNVFVEGIFRATLEETLLGDGTSALALFDQYTEGCVNGVAFGTKSTSEDTIVEACSIAGRTRV